MSLQQALAARLQGRVTVLGIGNPLRGDDAAGPLVTRRLRPAPGLRAIEAEEVPESHLGAVVASRPDTIVLVDAVEMGAPPGSLALVDTGELVRYAPTTHRVPLDLLASFLAGETGASVFLVAIQPGRTALAGPPSREVEEAAALVAAVMNGALEDRCGGRPC